VGSAREAGSWRAVGKQGGSSVPGVRGAAAPSRRQTGAVSFARYPQARSIRESITDRRGSSQGLAAVRDFDPAYVGSGSFTSFPLSRRVRFAPRADIRPTPAFMSRRFTRTSRGADAGCLYRLNTQHDPWRASSLAWCTGGDDEEVFSRILRTRVADINANDVATPAKHRARRPLPCGRAHASTPSTSPRRPSVPDHRVTRNGN